MADNLTHFDEQGRARMVDVSAKSDTERRAVARGRVVFSKESFDKVRAGVKKGDVASIAELAGVMGAKQTSSLIPLCHPLPITGLSVRVEPDEKKFAFVVTAEVKTTGKTGVEMEALTAVMTACLTVYDMAKAVDKSMTIEGVELVEKSGGKSGDFNRGK
ncbi:cyclic pyranopterin monophosphate synthase MoaC [Hyphococcus flavus]|uniref:Cyclic pyranopterin monophosphate synthase n=1 Tax=Hyphococcus flavus TaxID=1866326 RepID=A0AAE9ZD35_9PROT|nr:cyclic pyranopterin monophosphate synthase MoaC [Hyphococcus flavus]WDI31340.1 cyclic pyranopterin monophosphate synthase MoaC [Hyphococcus flavus]